MLHIKLNEMEHRAPCEHMICPNTHHQPWVESNQFKVKTFFLKLVMLHIKLIGLEHGSKCQTIFFLKLVRLHIKLKGMELRAQWEHKFCLYTHPQPVGRVKR